MRNSEFCALGIGFAGLLIVADTSVASAAPRAPQGIYATIDISDYVSQNNLPPQGADAEISAFYDSLLSNPAVSGLDIELHWDFAQPNPPPMALNWGYVDDAFTEAAAFGKTVHLVATAGFNSPPWLWDASQPTGIPSCDPLFKGNPAPGCGTVTFNYYAENTDQDGNGHKLVLPLPWNPSYISNWQAFLSTLQARYGSNPALVAITMAGPTAASPEMIMPNNYNTCASDNSNSDASGRCYTCPHGITPPCTQSNGLLAEDMWNTLFLDTSSYPQNSDEAFIDQWTKTINFYQSLFANVTLDITPADGTGFPSFGSGFPFTPTPGNVLYHPECDYSDTGGSTYANHNFQTRSCDATTTILSYFLNTFGGPNGDGMASQTSGMEAQDATMLGSFSRGGNTGDVGVPGVKYLANFTVAGPPQQEVMGGAQFDHQFSGSTTAEEGCPQGANGCPGITPEQAEYNVLQVFFLGTPGANRFGSSAVLGSQPTPRFLQVFEQDIIYAQSPTSVAQPILDPTTGVAFQLSAQDMLNMAEASLLGRHVAHDFDNDGRSDILWRDIVGDVGIWLMNGATIVRGGSIGAVSGIWSAVGQRDFNGNGTSDILWRDNVGDAGMWLMNGVQIASTSVLGNVATTWSVAGTGDFNGDGRGDIVWRDSAGNVGIWLMNGSTILQSAVVGKVSTNWGIAGADMNGEIFWRNAVTGEVGIWVMKGTQIAQAVDFGAMPLTWTIAGIGDFDGNGSTDILWRDNLGNVGIWLMNGTQILSSTVLGNVPNNWSIAQTGDYNGDTKSDILWIDNLGNVAAWFMNGTAVTSVKTYGNIGTAWSAQSLNAE